MMKKLKNNILCILGLAALLMGSLASCTDEPDAENFYSSLVRWPATS